jgi:predicted Rossmann fold nucleotide-binding protein DprA/Smf involved in DNA uptake
LFQHFPEVTRPLCSVPVDGQARPLPETLTIDERALVTALGADSIHPDELATRCKRAIGEVLSMLSGLEIVGVVQQTPGRLFRRV